jgi:hypothetical protein
LPLAGTYGEEYKMIRKNKKFIDPRYFMDEKMELNESAGGYYVKYGSYGSAVTFHDPEGNQLPDLEGNIDDDGDGMTSAELLRATENLPEFTKLVDKEALEAHKAREVELGREGLGVYPDPDFMDRYWLAGSWDSLLQLYLQKVLNVANAQVVEAPKEEPELDDWDRQFSSGY